MEFIAEFKTLFVQTSLNMIDLVQKLKEKMSKEYLTYMSYIVNINDNTSSIYDVISNMEFKIDKAFNELDNNLTQASEKASTALRHETVKLFHDPNTMDINVTKLNDTFKDLTNIEEIKKQFSKVMRDHCKMCSSFDHKLEDLKHRRFICNWCKKARH